MEDLEKFLDLIENPNINAVEVFQRQDEDPNGGVESEEYKRNCQVIANLEAENMISYCQKDHFNAFDGQRKCYFQGNLNSKGLPNGNY